MTYWITKYALTEGIQPLDGEDIKIDEDGYFSKGGPTFGGWDDRRHFYSKSDWHSSEYAAIARAEEMRLAKIKSLKKSLSKMEALSFVPVSASK